MVLAGEPLLDSIEFSTGDPCLRVEVFDRLRGWYLYRFTEGVPGAAHEAIIARMNRERDLLMRRALDF